MIRLPPYDEKSRPGVGIVMVMLASLAPTIGFASVIAMVGVL